MKLNSDQLDTHLEQGLAPVYLISGDDPLLVQEAADQVRHAAREQGFSSREIFHIQQGFDWSQFLQAADSMSLFAEQRLLELRMPTGKPGDAGRKALAEYLDNPPQDTVLMIITGKLDKSIQATKWVKEVQSTGVFVPVWPIELAQLPRWITNRLRQAGLQADAEAVSLLAERVEGNLMAASQEIEKLRLLYGEGRLTAEQVEEGVANSARYDVFKLVDAALAGDASRCARILKGLRQEGVEPVLVLWALLRELRQLARMAADAQNNPLDSVLTRYRVWSKRKSLIKNALNRFSVRQWQQLVQLAGGVDRVIKGAAPGNAWDELLQLCLALAGVRTGLPAARARANAATSY
jgi:DNA polymerase-3 subunit delta